MKLLSKGSQDRVDGREDRSTISGSHQELGDGRHYADGWLWPNRLQGSIQRSQCSAVDDLRVLHGLAGSQIQAGHVSPNVVVTDDRYHPRHLDEVRPRWSRMKLKSKSKFEIDHLELYRGRFWCDEWATCLNASGSRSAHSHKNNWTTTYNILKIIRLRFRPK